MSAMSKQKDTIYLVKLGFMIAVVVVISFVPILGYVPLAIIKATTVHIPVIIGAILLGPKAGAILGLTMGVTSLIKNTIEPTVTSFVFSPVIPVPGQDGGDIRSLIIVFIPRILIGVVAGLIYRLISRWDERGYISCAISAIVASLTNTALVLGGIYFIFGEEYAQAAEVGASALGIFLIGVVATNGLAEAALAMVLTVAIARPLMLYFKYREKKNADKQAKAEQNKPVEEPVKEVQTQPAPEQDMAAPIIATEMTPPTETTPAVMPTDGAPQPPEEQMPATPTEGMPVEDEPTQGL